MSLIKMSVNFVKNILNHRCYRSVNWVQLQKSMKISFWYAFDQNESKFC